MGYTLSGKAIEAVESFLNQMVDSKSNLAWKSTDPIKLAYRIRTGILSAKKLGPPSFGKLLSKYKLLVREDQVIAQLRDSIADVQFIFTGLDSPLAILTEAIKLKDEEEIVFKETGSFNDSQLGIIYNWAQKNKFYIIYSPHSGELILTKKDLEEIAWKPKA